MEYYSAIKKNGILLFVGSGWIGGHNVKLSNSGSGKQRLHVFSHMWKIEPKDKCIHKTQT
jgi:hypothetical protein